MKRRFPLIAWGLAWAVLVVLSATSVWWAISRAGSHVTSVAAPQLPPGSATATPSATPSATASRPPTVAGPTATPSPSRKPTAHAPTAGATPSRTPTAEAAQRSWNGPAGRVTATCRGSRIRLDAAVPADGYSVEIGDRGPESLHVEFHQSEGEHEANVTSVCRDGVPQFDVEQE